MSMQEFVDILHELIVVDTVEGLVKKASLDEDKITVCMRDGAKFVVSVEEAR